MKTNDAIFISGVGSNLKSVLDHYPYKKPFVYANKDCNGLSWARRRGCNAEVKSLSTGPEWDEFAKELNRHGVKRVFLLGFMKIIPALFLEAFSGEVLNIHPSLLPSYPGLKSIEKAFEDGAEMGASLHKVTEGVDEGPVLIRKKSLLKSDLAGTRQNVHFAEQSIVCKYLNLVSF